MMQLSGTYPYIGFICVVICSRCYTLCMPLSKNIIELRWRNSIHTTQFRLRPLTVSGGASLKDNVGTIDYDP